MVTDFGSGLIPFAWNKRLHKYKKQNTGVLFMVYLDGIDSWNRPPWGHDPIQNRLHAADATTGLDPNGTDLGRNKLPPLQTGDGQVLHDRTCWFVRWSMAVGSNDE